MTSIIQTTAVVSEKPDIITSYDEILSSGQRPAWPNIAAEYLEFESADPESAAGRIWRRALSMGHNKSLMVTDSENHWHRLMNGEEVLLAPGTSIFMFSYLSCTYRKSVETTRLPFIATDDSAAEKMYTTLMSNLMPDHKQDRLKQVISRHVESGMEKFVTSEMIRDFFHHSRGINDLWRTRIYFARIAGQSDRMETVLAIRRSVCYDLCFSCSCFSDGETGKTSHCDCFASRTERRAGEFHRIAAQ